MKEVHPISVVIMRRVEEALAPIVADYKCLLDEKDIDALQDGRLSATEVVDRLFWILNPSSEIVPLDPRDGEPIPSMR